MTEDRQEWRCFHCGEVFTDHACAREHFGPDEGHITACVVAAHDGGLLRAFRESETEVTRAYQALHDESGEAVKAMLGMEGRIRSVTRDAEEAGYAKGYADGSGLTLRPEVLAFALQMEAKLQENDHKPGWKGDDPFELLRRLQQELNELQREVGTAFKETFWPLREGETNIRHPRASNIYRLGTPEERTPAYENIPGEAADIGNFAMMIFDVCRNAPHPKDETP